MAIRGELKPHRLYLLRHADAEGDLYGLGDASRELSRQGRSQARDVGVFLADVTIDLVLCSSATRTRQTAQLLNLHAPIRHLPRLYNANARQILAELTGVDDAIRTVLVVGHAPGLPGLAYHLADGKSDAAALSRVRPVYPPATLVGLEFVGGWSGLSEARLFTSRLASP
ncbi:MAG: histidine phosphatase family protein [Propionibacteriales bacterium]|jgi:phosphohistidine phosphatase|nr:histidine phosphatase family protein [Propionibacteriales bacterium]